MCRYICCQEDRSTGGTPFWKEGEEPYVKIDLPSLTVKDIWLETKNKRNVGKSMIHSSVWI